MPQIVTAIAIYASAYIGGTIAVWETIVTIAMLAANYAVARALAPKFDANSIRASAMEVNVRDPAAPRQIVWGRRKLSGVMYPIGVSGTKNEYLHILLLIAGHEVEELGDVYFNDEVIPLDGSGNATGRFAGFARVKKHTGAYNQTADSDAVAEVTGWTTSHRLQGIAHLYIRLKASPDLFSGVPEFYCMTKGRRVFDPRDGGQAAATYATWTYSANSALVLYDWLRGVPMLNAAGTIVRNFGLRAADAEIDTTAVTDAANICDEHVVLADASTEHRYESHGLLYTNATAEPGIAAMRSAMGGDCVYIGGLWVIRAGAYRTPTVTLTDSDLRGPLMGVKFKPSRREVYNGVKGVYIAEKNNWQPSDFPVVTNATYLAQDGGERLWLDMELPFTTSPACAQRLAKLELERSRQSISFTAPCLLTAFRNQATDVVQLSHARFGWTTKAFEVQGFAFVVARDDAGEPYLGVDLTLRETASGVFTWANGEETVVDLAPNTDLPDPFTVPTPGAPTLTDEAITQPDGTVIPALKVSWTLPSDIYVQQGGVTEIEYKKTADTDWIVWAQPRGDQAFDRLTDVKVGVAYDVRIRFQNQLGVRGAYATTSNHTVVAIAVTPSAPGAATKTADATYTPTGGDGTVFASMTFTIPALPAGAAKQWLLMKKYVAPPTSVLVVGQKYQIALYQSGDNFLNVGAASNATGVEFVATGTTPTTWSNGSNVKSVSDYVPMAGPFTNVSSQPGVIIMDLTPGVIYTVALIAFSSLDVASITTEATSSPFTAPSKTAAPGVPTSLSLTAPASGSVAIPPFFYNAGSTNVLCLASLLKWTNPADADLSHVNIKVTTDNDANSVNYSAWMVNGGNLSIARVLVAPSSTAVAFAYCPTISGAYVFIQTVNTSGVASAWTACGGLITSSAGYPAGTSSAKDVGTTTGTVAAGDDARLIATGTTAGTQAAGDDSRITGAAQKASNLSDIANAATARSNLGVTATGGDTTYNYRANNLSDVASAATAKTNLKIRSVQVVKNLTGGAAYENVTHNHGFGTLQEAMLGDVTAGTDWDNLAVKLDYASGSNDANNSVLRFYTRDGSNITSTITVRATLYFIE